jgi:S-adenosyl methyltransferase
VISHGTANFTPGVEGGAGVYRSVGTSTTLRTREEVTVFFDGWDLTEPGVPLSHRWRPDEETTASAITDAEASCYVAVARKIA